MALVGNPNTGKTTLFNALTGFRRHVANYPGVTVDIGRGALQRSSQPVEILDLPGTYSLAAVSPDEMVVSNTLAGRVAARPDVVVMVLDASNLPRNLYLLSQVIEFGLPVVAALNMVDEAESRGIRVDERELSRRLGIPVVPTVAVRAESVRPLVVAIEQAVSRPTPPRARVELPPALIEQADNFIRKTPVWVVRTRGVTGVSALGGTASPGGTGVSPGGTGVSPVPAGRDAGATPAPIQCASEGPASPQYAVSLGGALTRAEAIRILLDREGYAERQFFERGGSPDLLIAARQQLADAGVTGPAVEVRARYAWIDALLSGVIARPDQPIRTWSDRIDAILTHRVGGGAALLVVLFVLFQSIFSWARPLMDFVDLCFARLGGAVGPLASEGVLRSLLVDGVIAGVGGVLVFLPQILILFAFIAVLEDCGYMARAAFMADRVMRAMGLSGRSFIPLLSSFACAVPAIMGTRTIADRRERYVTILIAPFMSCSARLPVYVLMISAFVPATMVAGGWVGLQGLVMLAMYLVGVLFAIPIAWLLKRTAFAGPMPTFMLELPSYKLPRLRAVGQRMFSAGREFVVRAGTIILAVNLMVWALGYFPHRDAVTADVRAQAQVAGWDAERTDQELAGAYLRDSLLGRMGHWIEPAIRPIGWDWRIGVATIASLPAREVVIGTLSTIFNLGADDADIASLRTALREARWEGTARPLFDLPVALSIMVFFALCAQCTSTLAVIGRETNSWRWPIFSFVMMTTVAYAAAWGVAAAARSLVG
ncbi:Ferrous iron transport protein B [Phycisphaerae bacterium RAS1]|nr:Ferrous iron transport protein B [Phycisphaerae bacterium RAS1]